MTTLTIVGLIVIYAWMLGVIYGDYLGDWRK